MDFEPNERIIYMKVGVHAQEKLEDIIVRKQQEIEAEGFAMWGYGGNTCHPRTMVRPFVKDSPGPVRLVMQEIHSKHDENPVRASEYSIDGIDWLEIPPGISVNGSRMALCISTLEQVDMNLDLAATSVGTGNSKGKSGIDYLRGQVDKACLTIGDGSNPGAQLVKIGLTAELVDPFAVMVRD